MRGGEGKTSLVAKWAADLAYHNWPGCDAVFAWSFYSQGTRDQAAVSSDLFLAEALTFFGDAALANSPAGAFDKGKRLAQLVAERRALLILDGVEPLQYPPGPPLDGKLKDEGVAALLKGLAAHSFKNGGLCVVTTRYALPDLRAFLGHTVHEEKLLRLSSDAGVALLQALGVRGSLRKRLPSADGQEQWNEYEQLVEDVKGHALTLNLLGSYLRDAHAGDIRRRDLIKLEEADAEVQGGHAFRVMDAYVQSFETGGKTEADNAKGRRALALLQLLGLFDRPATADCLNALWQPPAIDGLTEPLVGLSEAHRNLSLKRLENAKLLTVNHDAAFTLVALDTHPLIREYFAARLSKRQPEAWRGAHRRLYEHLCSTTLDKPDATLDDLQPLYQAVAHGCQAGLQQEACEIVFFTRIRRQNEGYSHNKLGAFGPDLGAISYFFETRWSVISPLITEDFQAWLLNEAAICLRALGSWKESIVPLRLSGEMCVQKMKPGAAARAGNKIMREAAARRGNNLSELELLLGEVNKAVEVGEQSVTYADSGGNAFLRVITRVAQADALHQMGCYAEAETLFRKAEQLHAKRQLNSPLLLSSQAFHYYDLMLAVAERAAWRTTIMESGMSKVKLIEACRHVSERAAQTLKAPVEYANTSLIDIPLDHLALGRASLYAAILEQSPIHNSQREIEAAVSGLHRAGVSEYLIPGLLTRAWLRSMTGARTGQDSAQEDLDEAWEIAERGPMKLFLADIHLYRARLFGGMRDEGGGMRDKAEPYPWVSPQHDLAEAERLINECGYHRRDEELADAKRAIL